MKKSPFEISNQGEMIDENFFIRLRKFEKYYENHSIEDGVFLSNYDAIKIINTILQKDELSLEDIIKAIEIYNIVNSNQHYEGAGWFDLRLHLRHIAFVYGKEFGIDEDFNLIENTSIYYYRIKEVSVNGDVSFSKIVSVNVDFTAENNEVRMYPNPAVNELNFDFTIYNEVSDLTVNIFDASGRVVRKNAIVDIELENGNKLYRISLDDINEGLYSVHINMDGQSILRKLIVMKK